MAREVTNYDDIIDSRDVEERIAELESMAEIDDDDNVASDGLDDDEREELTKLHELRQSADGVEDWQHGATLIRDSHFETYAQELAEELELIPADAKWPATCIDWDQAAHELRMDYTSVEFDGVTYYVR